MKYSVHTTKNNAVVGGRSTIASATVSLSVRTFTINVGPSCKAAPTIINDTDLIAKSNLKIIIIKK
jgi:hypothetical protein